MRILIVEDEQRLSEALAELMRREKYDVDVCNNGEDGLEFALSGIYDVIVLDVMLPKKDGFSVVHELRKKDVQTPVILLTAKDETEDKVRGLDSGADDYLTKPFVPEELLARIRALSRRQETILFETLTFKDITLHLNTQLLERGAKSVRLSHKEFEILKLLLSQPTAIQPKETLLTKVWGYDSDAEDNNVEVYISFLRKKLYFLGSQVGIGSVRKVGYRLEWEE